tara:strand:+ start:1839 stop:1973 length:135 start_codon:yes stop_codon:yes gene_type:complete
MATILFHNQGIATEVFPDHCCTMNFRLALKPIFIGNKCLQINEG